MVQRAPGKHDDCQTPPEAVEFLLRHVELDGVVWEPAAGYGNIVSVLEGEGYRVIATDKYYRESTDFLTAEPRGDCLVTNPPYSIKQKWIERCYEIGMPFALLMPVSYLGTKGGNGLFREHGVDVLIPDRRINFYMPEKGWEGQGAWFPTCWYTWKMGLPERLVFASLSPCPPVSKDL